MMAYYQALKQDPFDHIPVTFHVQNGQGDAQFSKFTDYFNQIEAKIRDSEGGMTSRREETKKPKIPKKKKKKGGSSS